MKVKLPSYQVTKLLLNYSCPISSHYWECEVEEKKLYYMGYNRGRRAVMSMKIVFLAFVLN